MIYIKKRILKFIEKLNYGEPKNINLFIQGFTHRTYSNENKNFKNDYQRLEIFGDSILNKIVTEFLFFNFPDYSEADITEKRKKIVCGQTLYKASVDLGFENFLLLGNGFVKNVDSKKRILEDVLESFIACLYIEYGEESCRDFIEKKIIKYFLNNDLDEMIDYKSLIQEFFQSNIYSHKGSKANKICYSSVLDYSTNLFHTKLIFNNILYGVGSGKTKKESEKNAAKNAYEKCYIK